MLSDPTLPELRTAAEHLSFRLSDEDLELHRPVVTAALAGLRALDRAPDPLPEVRYPRTPGREPTPEENPLGGWRVRTEIAGADDGLLAGRTVAIKDNVMVAGVPMENGTPFLTGYLPPIDATVVTRILDAGATITGKSVCEAFCLSGGSHTAVSGPVRNPHNPAYVAGGSSSGSGALVAAGAVDMAVGGDQGGSIRIPAAVCGIVGMKPTFGLVPYTGALPLLGDAKSWRVQTATTCARLTQK
jgi:amidase